MAGFLGFGAVRAAWHFGQRADYCRGCAALDRDCSRPCPYAAHAPATVEGAAAWSAGTACTVAILGGASLDMAGAIATARELGAKRWAVAELLTALRAGMAEGLAARQSVPTDAGR